MPSELAPYVIPEDQTTKSSKRRQRVSTAELFAALEGLLPSAEIEIDCLSGYVEDFPDDPDHAVDAERVRAGRQAIELAKRLIAKKSGTISRKQRAFTERHRNGDAG